VSAPRWVNPLDEIEVVVEDGTLKIGLVRSTSTGTTARQCLPTAPFPWRFDCRLGRDGHDKVAGDFEGDVAGSGDLKLISVRAAKVLPCGSGDVEAIGKADSVDISIAGSGDVRTALATRAADVSIADPMSPRMPARAPTFRSWIGASTCGGAKCSVSKAGSGNVVCG
jgi:hypothetical protein